jgi:hypothetical protein
VSRLLSGVRNVCIENFNKSVKETGVVTADMEIEWP